MLYPSHCLVSQFFVIAIFWNPLLTYLVTLCSPSIMLMSCLVLLSMSIKCALKHLTYNDFKQHKRGICGINIGLSLDGNKFKFKLPKGEK